MQLYIPGATTMKLKGPGRRALAVDFSGGRISSDGGGLLLQVADRLISLSENLSLCFTDHRRPDRINHSLQELVVQRVLCLALGYEDLDDHNELASQAMCFSRPISLLDPQLHSARGSL